MNLWTFSSNTFVPCDVSLLKKSLWLVSDLALLPTDLKWMSALDTELLIPETSWHTPYPHKISQRRATDFLIQREV
jgi:hypothetical protein